MSIQGTPFDPLWVQYVFPVALGQDRRPQSPAPVQPSITQSHALVQLTLPHPPVPEHVTRQRPFFDMPPAAMPQVTSPHAPVPEHVTRQSAAPHWMLLHAASPVHMIVHDVAPEQLMLSHAPPEHVMSQW